MNKEEWLKYKTVTYYIENPNKQVIGQELVIAGNKPLGLDNVNLPEGKRLVGWSPSLDTVVTDNMEIKAILEDTPRPAGNVVELTANLDGGKSTLMQNGEKLYINQGTRLSDPVNASELSRIRATVPTKLGYKFKGWSVSENEPLNSNMEIRAIWEREKVRATFTAPGSDTNYNESSVIDAGTAPNAPLKNPERKGFRFNGWTPNVSLPIYSDTTYTADWVKKDESGENQEYPSNGDNDKKDNNGGNNNGGNNNGNGNNGGTTNQYIYNGRVLTGDPNNNSTNIFNSRNVPGTNNNNPSGRGIGLTGINGNNGGTNGTTIPKVDKDLPKSGESNIKAVIGIFAISILCGVMYIYQNKLRKITRKSRKK